MHTTHQYPQDLLAGELGWTVRTTEATKRRRYSAAFRRIRSLVAGWVHFPRNAPAILIALCNLPHRLGEDPGAAVVPFGFILPAAVIVLFLAMDRLGGELVFRHRIGIIDNTSETADQSSAMPEGFDLGRCSFPNAGVNSNGCKAKATYRPRSRRRLQRR
jgi:hypothetical protein